MSISKKAQEAFLHGFRTALLEKGAMADMIGGVAGAANAPEGRRMEGAFRGASGAGMGGAMGGAGGALGGSVAGGGLGMLAGLLMKNPALAQELGLVGAAGGGIAGLLGGGMMGAHKGYKTNTGEYPGHGDEEQQEGGGMMPPGMNPNMQQEGGMPPGAGGPPPGMEGAEGPEHPGMEVPPEVVLEAMHSMFHDPNTPPDACEQCAMISEINEGGGAGAEQGGPPPPAGPPGAEAGGPPPPAGPPEGPGTDAGIGGPPEAAGPPQAAGGPPPAKKKPKKDKDPKHDDKDTDGPPKKASATDALIFSLTKRAGEGNAYRHPSAATQLFGNPQMTMKEAFARLKDPTFSGVHGGFSTEYENDVLAGSGVATNPSRR